MACPAADAPRGAAIPLSLPPLAAPHSTEIDRVKPRIQQLVCGRLTAHAGVDKIAFTGSTATGKKVMASAAAMVKRVTLELGGNDAAIVLDDADPKLAARKVYDGSMTNAGQICVAIKRAYIPAGMYDAFCEEIAALANEAIVDDGSKQGTTWGPSRTGCSSKRSARSLRMPRSAAR